MTPKALANLMSIMATERRVGILKILLEAKEPVGLSMLSGMLDIKENILSSNLSELSKVGLVFRRPQGKFVFFEVNRELMLGLIRFWRTSPKGD